jgi:hypothetical protein
MIRNVKNILTILLILAGAYFAYQFFFVPTPPPDPDKYIEIGGKQYEILKNQRDTIIEYDTIKVPEYIPKVKFVDREVEVPADVDTVAILKDYYVKRYYEDTVKQYPDSTGGNSVVVKDTITHNKIVSRQVDFNVETITITDSIVVKEPLKTKVFIGPGVNIGPTVGVNGTIVIKNSQDKAFFIQPGLQNVPGTNDIKGYIGGGLLWKIDLNNVSLNPFKKKKRNN